MTVLDHSRTIQMYALAIVCALVLGACGSGSGHGTAHISGSPSVVAAAQLAGADHAPGERVKLAADLTTLYPDCQETTATLGIEISDAEQDLGRHGITGNAETVANALVIAAGQLTKSAKPTVCNQLISGYLDARGG